MSENPAKENAQGKENQDNPPNLPPPPASASDVPPAPPANTSGAPGSSQLPPAPAEKEPEKQQKKTRTSAKAANQQALVEILEEMDAEDAKKKGKGKTSQTPKTSQTTKNPTLHSQLATLLDRMDKQAARTDELFSIVKPRSSWSPEKRHDRRRSGENYSPTHRRRSRNHHVPSSHHKKRSPKNGRASCGARRSRATSRHMEYSSPGSSNSSYSDIEGQVRCALDMMEPRFKKHKGKVHDSGDSVKCYRPFAYLEREQQREILKHGHPEELTFNQHVTGLCAMAIELTDERTKAYGILTHLAQVMDDYSFVPWQQTRAFSNTVVANIARGKWSWNDDRLIEKCRSNHYMRRRTHEESCWSVPCPRYNKGRCEEHDTHQIGEVTMRHVCSHCAVNGYDNPHTLRACNRRKGAYSSSQQNRSNNEEKRDSRSAKYHGNKQDVNMDGSKN